MILYRTARPPIDTRTARWQRVLSHVFVVSPSYSCSCSSTTPTPTTTRPPPPPLLLLLLLVLVLVLVGPCWQSTSATCSRSRGRWPSPSRASDGRSCFDAFRHRLRGCLAGLGCRYLQGYTYISELHVVRTCFLELLAGQCGRWRYLFTSRGSGGARGWASVPDAG